MLIPRLGFSQGIYPKEAVINGDTLVLIQPDQLAEINCAIHNWEQSLQRESVLLRQYRESVSLSRSSDSVVSRLSILNREMEMQIQQSSVAFSDYISAQDKRVTRLKRRRWLYAVCGFLAGIPIGALIGGR